MITEKEHLQSLQDIRQMMEKSSRFISLSGWSGVSAGICALIAAWIAHGRIADYRWTSGLTEGLSRGTYDARRSYTALEKELLLLAAGTFIVAGIVAFIFTWLRSRKTGVPVWGFTARRVMINVLIPMAAGGLVILRMMDIGYYGLIAPVSLIFYGLALINASKYTLPDIRYLGFAQLVLGSINLWLVGWGLYFWAIGFGVLHILYGFVMWWKNERKQG
ncbi:MAG TPA: hypothetical protein VEX63_12435 [Flavisolibacter sp.]|nr:hypothetical protein [Flavisolibacter sp.]